MVEATGHHSAFHPTNQSASEAAAFEFARSYELRTTAAMTAIAGALLVSCSSGGTSPSTQVAVGSPTPDSVTRIYVALVNNSWIQEQAADGTSNDSNLAAKVCLGTDPPGAPTNLQLINPPMCLERAVAILTNQQKFLGDLDSTPPPPKFGADDQAFRTQLPKAIADLKAL